jgi:Protein of unknown function (DUF1566)
MNRRPMTLPGGRFVASAALFVLLVTVPALASAPAGRFTASAGVVHDSKTGLNWQQAVSTTLYTYASALTYCSGNVAALPGSGWRLPAIKELQTLVDDSVASPGPTIDAAAFPSTPASFFWSATVCASPSSDAWYVDFSNGYTGGNDMTVTFYIRCVR